MQFRLSSLFIAVGVVAVATFLVVAAPVKAAVVIMILLAGTLFCGLGRKEFPRSAKLVGFATAIFFLYFLSDGLLVALRPVVLRAATEDDKLRDEYFCVLPMPEMTVRNIVVVEGTFARDTWLTASLYVVRAGSVEELSGFTVGRSPNRIGEAEWMSMRMTMALADAKKPNGRVTQLGVVGPTRGGGNGSGTFVGTLHGLRGAYGVHDFPAKPRHVALGRMNRGQMRIFYVEGDSDAKFTPEMSIQEFATVNSGNYVVVIAGLER